MIRLKNMKTDKIEYFRDPGVTWLQILYLEAFHCVDFFPYVSLFLLCFSFLFHWFSLFKLCFIVFQLFNVMLWALIRLKNTKTDKIEYFRDPRVTWLQITWIFSIVCVEMLLCWFSQYLCAYIYIYYSGCIGFIGFKSVGAMPPRNSQLLPAHRVVAPHTLNLRF